MTGEQAGQRALKFHDLVTGEAISAVTRDPAAEQKIHLQIVSALYALSFGAMFTKTQVDDRLIARAIQRFNDPKYWAEWADDIWGSA